MKNNGKFKILNITPKLLISHYDLQAIRHIVAIAPQEAQWFHRLERIEEGSTTYYRIYEMYIPEQYTSAAQVESEPLMMVKMFKDLREQHGLEKTNKIMQNLTVWCHSHHNMGVSPSGQDVKQFAEQIKNAHDANVDLPQIMLIFNKKDTFYSKIFDPKYGLVFENVELLMEDYDFSHIDKEAKTKFKKKVVPKATFNKTSGWNRKGWNSKRVDFVDWGWGPNDTFTIESSSDSEAVLSEEINDYISTGLKKHPSISKLISKYKVKSKSKRSFVDAAVKYYNLVGLSAFAALLTLESDFICEIPQNLDWIIDRTQVPTTHEEIVNDLESLRLEKNFLSCLCIAAKNIEVEAQTSAEADTGILELDQVVEPFLMIVEALYPNEEDELEDEYTPFTENNKRLI